MHSPPLRRPLLRCRQARRGRPRQHAAATIIATAAAAVTAAVTAAEGPAAAAEAPLVIAP